MEDLGATVERIRNSVRTHSKWFEGSLPMIASENLLSPYAKEMMISDFHSRYAEGLPGERYYEGNHWVDEVELECLRLAKEVFRCDFADVRPISGTVANIAVLRAMTEHGDIVGSCRLAEGAHISSAAFGAFGIRGVKPVYYAFDTKSMQLDLDETKRILLKERPKTCLFGLSLFLFPFPLNELSDTLVEIGAKGWYDGAHVLGLIGGRKFQDPLHEGCVVMSGSTHKTLPGPQHGILLGQMDPDPDLKKRLTSAAFPAVTSNHHLNEMAALAVSLAEHLKWGEDYAKATISNAKALAQALHERGFEVLCPDRGFTESHQVAVRVAKEGGGEKVAKALEQARFVVNKNLLPGDKSPKNPEGIRLGSQELTRVGMGPSEMKQVAELMHLFLHKGKSAAEIAPRVEELKRPFTTLKYCFAAGEAGYRYYDLVGHGPK